MKYVIVITMFFLNPTLRDLPDGVVIHNADETPMYFRTLQECLEHATFNAVILHDFAINYFKGEAVVRQILCVKKEDTSV